MSLINTEKNEKVTDFSKQITMYYGDPKVGKSTICSCYDDILYLATEVGYNHLDLERKPTLVNSWKKMKDVCNELAGMINAGNCPFKTIVIDTIDELDQMCVDYILDKLGIAKLSDLDKGDGYIAVKDELMGLLKKLSMLGLGMVFVSHGKMRVVKERVGIKVDKWDKNDINISPSRGLKILSMCDLIIYLTSNIDDEGVQSGVAYTKPSKYHVAGDRSGRLPEEMTYDPTNIKSLYKELKSYFT